MDEPRDMFDFLQDLGRDWLEASYAGAAEEARLHAKTQTTGTQPWPGSIASTQHHSLVR